MPNVSIDMPVLHAGQRFVLDNMTRFNVLACGRRWGKTRLGVSLCLAAGIKAKRAWWVAPTYRMGEVAWRQIVDFQHQIPGTVLRAGDMKLTLPTGGEVCTRSADTPDTLRGEGLDLVVLDECAFMKESVWFDVLRPALADRKGTAVFISTPKGRNWFWRLFRRGQEQGGLYRSFRFPTISNPYIDAGEIEEAKRTLPERIYLQEFEAEFIEDAGLVFRNVSQCVDPEVWRDFPDSDGQYIFGVDWGKHEDWTVITVLDVTRNAVVYIDRFNQIDYFVQVQRLAALANVFQPVTILAEVNAMGEPLVEQLSRYGYPVTPFMMTGSSKTYVIESLAQAFETGEITIPPHEILQNELLAYEMKRGPTGLVGYSAPSGMHDDCVVSLALAWYGVAAADKQQMTGAALWRM